MSESRHTPGPWGVTKEKDGGHEVRSNTTSRLLQEWSKENPEKSGFSKYATGICAVRPSYNGSGKEFGPHKLIGDDELEANAQLIAAAPDLLKSCERMISAFDKGGYSFGDNERQYGAIGQMRNAIAKAKGE